MDKINVLITDGLNPEGLALLKNSPEISLTLNKQTPSENLPHLLAHHDAVIVRSATTITQAALSHSPSKLKLIVRAGAGLDNIDVEAAQKKGVVVKNTASANSNAVAEHVLALLFSVARAIPQSDQSLRQEKWIRKDLSGFEISGKTLGIVGMGNIGRLLAQKAQGLGMNVLTFDPFAGAHPYPKAPSLETLLTQSDVVSLHLPKTKETENLLDESKIFKMKKGAVLIQTSRGGIVDERALLKAVEAGHLRGAGFDVFEKEPITSDSPLLKHPHIVCTPHTGASTDEAQIRVGTTAAQLILDFFKLHSSAQRQERKTS